MNWIGRVLLLGGMLSLAMHGGSITIGAANGGECDPFTCNPSTTTVGQSIEWQQVYSGVLFGSNPYSISAIQFPDVYISTHGHNGGPVIAGDYLISFAYTSNAVGGLSSALASNISSGEATFFDGTLATSWTLAEGLTVFGTPYIYNPALGNLLIDIVATNQPYVPNLSGNGYLDSDSTTSVTSSAFNITGVSVGTTPIGLVTTFDPVPEPGSLALITGGLLLVLGRRLLCRQIRWPSGCIQ